MKNEMASKPKSVSREEGCFVCGLWADSKKMCVGKRKSVSPDVQRRVLVCSLIDVYLCWRCKASCSLCKCVIPGRQAKDHDGMCEECVQAEKQREKGGKKRRIVGGK